MADVERMCLPPMSPGFESFTWHHKCSCLALWVLFLVLRCFSSHENQNHERRHSELQCIGGFRGGAEGIAHTPLFFSYFQNVLPFTVRVCFENRFIKYCLILSFETLTLLYFASRIRPQCCMLHDLKSKVFIHGEEGGGLSPLFLHFLDLTLQCVTKFIYLFILFM